MGSRNKTPLRVARERMGLNPVQVAAAAGLSVTQVHNLEEGRHIPKLETARRLAAVLETPLDVLFPPAPERKAA